MASGDLRRFLLRPIPGSVPTKVDPIKFEVLRNGFLEATEEMALALRRSAYSTNIKTRCGFSCSLFDRDLRPIAQSFSQPNHLGSMVGTVRLAVLEYGPGNLGPDDQLVVNYPYPSGAHLNDIVVIAPFHYRGEIHGYFGNLAHHFDVGGGAPASVGAFREIYQEGVIVPPVKMVKAGEIVDDVFRLILSQIRSKRETAGDFRAQFAANNTGVRRLTALFDRHGPDTVNFCMDELIEYTDRRTAAELAQLPRGEYAAEGYVDNDGFTDRPVRLAVRVAVDDDGVLFDFTGSDPQRRAPVNSTWAQTQGNRFRICQAAARIKLSRKSSFHAARLSLPRMASFVGSCLAMLRARRRSIARFSGPWSFRFRWRSSFMVTSRTQCRQFSMAQWARTACWKRSGESGALMM